MLSKSILRLLSITILFGGAIVACVEPYDLDYTETKKILIIDAVLSDTGGDAQYVYIRESIPTGVRNFFLPTTEALVEVVVNDSESFRFTEVGDGGYIKPTDLKIQAGNQYRLEIKLADGREYRSEIEEFNETSPIERISAELEIEGLRENIGYEPAHYIYLDTKDKPGRGNNYVWSWKLYEKQFICESCTNGRYFIDRRTGEGACRDESTPLQRDIYFFDYVCESDCWQVFYNTEINAMSDTYVDGNLIQNRLIGKIPLYQLSGALLEVKQQSLSAGAFRYLKLLTEQSQTNGGLADTPPAPLIGNVKNVNDPNETIGGYFMVASERKQIFWLDRQDAIDQRLVSKGLLGRPVTQESSDNPERPPLAPCENSRFRTPNRPEGWIN